MIQNVYVKKVLYLFLAFAKCPEVSRSQQGKYERLNDSHQQLNSHHKSV